MKRKFNPKKLFPQKSKVKDNNDTHNKEKPVKLSHSIIIQVVSMIIVSYMIIIAIINLSLTKTSMKTYVKYSININVSDKKAKRYDTYGIEKDDLENILKSEELNNFISQLYYEKINALLNRPISFSCDENKLDMTILNILNEQAVKIDEKDRNDFISRFKEDTGLEEIIEDVGYEQYQLMNYISFSKLKISNMTYDEIKEDSQSFYSKVYFITSPIMIFIMFIVLLVVQGINYVRVKSQAIALLQLSCNVIAPGFTIFILSIGKIFFSQDSLYAINIAAISLVITIPILIIFVPIYILAKRFLLFSGLCKK